MNDPAEDASWMCDGWKDHEHGLMEHGRALSFREQLEWLEEATEFARRLREAPVRYPPAPAGGVAEDTPSQ